MRRESLPTILAAFVLVPLAAPQAADGLGVDDPQRVIHNPPESAEPGVWWHWMGWNVTKAGITRDLEEFERAGIGMARVFGMADACSPWAAHIENSPTDGLIAFTDPWWEFVCHAAAEGRRLGIDVALHNCPGYTRTGGPWITPELAMQQTFRSETRVEGGVAFEGLLPRPKVDPRGDMLVPMVNKQTGVLEKPIIADRANYWREIAVPAVPADGIVAKEPPDCEWRLGCMGNGGYLKRFPDWSVKNQPRLSNGRFCFTTWNDCTKDSPLGASGLPGPVRIPSTNRSIP